MSQKTPDTRNKLDNNKGINTRPKRIIKKGESVNLQTFKESIHPSHVKAKKVSNGEIFKKTHGFSKTMKRLMQKHEVYTVAEYRVLIKARKLTEKKARQKKHSDSVAYKKHNKDNKGKTKTTKRGKNQKTKTQSKK
jgi:hypothetical protein